MATFTREDLSIHYEVHGQGYPILAFAPGGTRSSIALWDRAPFHPVRELAGQFRVITMDQRNAGASRGAVSASDGWHTYASDHVALLDHLGVDRCHLLGGCIGAAFALRLIASAPDRVTAAVLQQPIGLHGDNREEFHRIFDPWADEVRRDRPEITADAMAGLKGNLYAGDFAFSVSREDVRRIQAPLLVLRGNDVYHPSGISEEIARIAPHARLISRWKEGDVARAVVSVRAFFTENTPPDAAGAASPR
jgi:pimeloyl-ACP methyl ester carboxylesterase